MIKLTELEEFILKSTDRKNLNPDEGRVFGLTGGIIKKAVVCWMPSRDAIAFAVKVGADALICHESLFFPYDAPRPVFGEVPKDYLSWSANANRLDLLVQHKIGVYRIHGTMDRMTICDSFVKKLNIGKLVHRDMEKLHFILEIPGQSFEKLALRVKERLNMKQLWIVGRRDKEVRRAGLAIGGGSLFVNIAWCEEFISLGCDVLICGESDEYAMEYFKDAGVCAVITSHRLTEHAGVKRFAQSVKNRFGTRLLVEFYENKLPYDYI